MIRNGFFMSIEGTQGSGKTTVADYLEKQLTDCGVTGITRISGTRGTALGDGIGRLMSKMGDSIEPLAGVLMEGAARCQQVNEVVIPILARGGILIADTFGDSVAVKYQTQAASGGGRFTGHVPHELTVFTDSINERVIKAAQPDLTIVLDGDPEVFAARRKKGEAPATLQNEARDGFLYLATSAPRFVTIDATEPKEGVAWIAWTTVKSFLRERGIRIVDPSEKRPDNAGAEEPAEDGGKPVRASRKGVKA